jgi:hypothetical protein
MRLRIAKLSGCLAVAAIFAGGLSVTPPVSSAQVSIGVSIETPPPDLPVYDQPPCPGDDYIWTPGYWAWGDDGYFWVPGTWVLAPEPGLFWTPGYWAWNGGSFVFNAGYWAPEVGFYGGVDYGHGYFGRGYEGGRWDRGHFYYNRAVNNVNVTVVHNTYNTTIVNRNVNRTRVSYNGGNGGLDTRASSREEAAARGRHIAPIAAQVEQRQSARSNQELRANVNHGKPPIAATARPGQFRGREAVAAKEAGAVHNPNARPGSNEIARPVNNGVRQPTGHAKDLPPLQHPVAPNTGNPKLDQKYIQQQNKLQAQQLKDRQKLQQQQAREDQRQVQQKANAAKLQQMEQKHQQQTARMVQRHTQQDQKLRQRQQPKPNPHPAPHPGKPH